MAVWADNLFSISFHPLDATASIEDAKEFLETYKLLEISQDFKKKYFIV